MTKMSLSFALLAYLKYGKSIFTDISRRVPTSKQLTVGKKHSTRDVTYHVSYIRRPFRHGSLLLLIIVMYY